jgi:hypothetical protein
MSRRPLRTASKRSCTCARPRRLARANQCPLLALSGRVFISGRSVIPVGNEHMRNVEPGTLYRFHTD